ncbi:L,D-transpeptidase, partial [Roseinatronobacter sp.]|uniref:L,D-transpeptidase n=1 Tax=Roseinatronobacter sp. TaxID=1945755 RepID=UPI0025E4FAC7
MKKIAVVLAGLLLALLPALPAQADRVVARVSISEQVMHVYHHGQLMYEWPVSTARQGKITPTGDWRPQFLSRNHRSSSCPLRMRRSNISRLGSGFGVGSLTPHLTRTIDEYRPDVGV